MTSPTSGNNGDSNEILRKRWLIRYLQIQGRSDTRLRTVLVGAAEDAQKQVSALENNYTFSKGVRSAQLRLTMQVIRDVLNDAFKQIIPIIQTGSKESAVGAVSAFTDTDRDYLIRAFAASASESGSSVNNFIEGQRRQAELQVANAVSRLYHSDLPLSGRVYRTRALATRWVQSVVTSEIVRGSSAKEIAKAVKTSIRPNTPGGVSYAAMRLGRTELNNAFHATSINLAKDRPWVEGMRWHLSNVHNIDPAKPEICETYSNQVFHVDNVPAKPHPQCRCFVTPEVESLEVFVRHLTAGQYRDWISNAA